MSIVFDNDIDIFLTMVLTFFWQCYCQKKIVIFFDNGIDNDIEIYNCQKNKFVDKGIDKVLILQTVSLIQ